ncbi:RNA polymerase sigma-54 factor [Taibaiella sp. KBW10]|uniref:RNA polymerase factor sigma-54 n=1 Tax=Taibaiella sp. KBW10 TaxID=2153357 RepID=UPI000F595BF0|nr:RNA polymerase factor sigma-54 [Taibaiella sp. KBW10]RQO30624.1 RNA polymerase sigma-54 factor [Taibaiella sp. KBW10]
MLKLTQSQKLLQKLSPQQIQFIKLLQVPTANLDEKIKEELEANPALDVGAEPQEEDPYHLSDNYDSEGAPVVKEESDTDHNTEDISDYLMDESDNLSDYHVREHNDDEEDSREAPIREESTFHEYLLSQVGLLDLELQDTQIAEQIIGSIDDDGYLRRDVMSIVDDLAFNRNIYVSEADVYRILKLIREFDPAGVAASDLQECLLLQLDKIVLSNPAAKHAKAILTDYFDEFTRKHYDKIRQQLSLSAEAFKEAIGVILKLTPRPGIAFSNGAKENGYIIPDFFIHNNNGVLELTLNARNAPELRVSEEYKDMLKIYDAGTAKDRKQKDAVVFIKQKIDAAKWFIDAIRQRQHTLLYTMKAIMEYQSAYFLSGNESSLRPMILKDIADKIAMDISTVSRVANSKYVQTEYGTFLLKYFFSEAITTDSGEEVSTYEVKNLIQDFVSQEDKHAPLSDEKLMEMLSEKGFQVARRTVAKYREQLHIPVARLRKLA